MFVAISPWLKMVQERQWAVYVQISSQVVGMGQGTSFSILLCNQDLLTRPWSSSIICWKLSEKCSSNPPPSSRILSYNTIIYLLRIIHNYTIVRHLTINCTHWWQTSSKSFEIFSQIPFQRRFQNSHQPRNDAGNANFVHYPCMRTKSIDFDRK